MEGIDCQRERERWEVKWREGRKRWKDGEEIWSSTSGHRGGGGGIEYVWVLD